MGFFRTLFGLFSRRYAARVVPSADRWAATHKTSFRQDLDLTCWFTQDTSLAFEVNFATDMALTPSFATDMALERSFAPDLDLKPTFERPGR